MLTIEHRFETESKRSLNYSQSVDPQLRLRLEELRAFLVPLWIKWGKRNRLPVGWEGKGMCCFSSVFLKTYLGGAWKFAGGSPPNAIDDKSKGGFLTDSWQPHQWIDNGELLIDLTATQFSSAFPAVYITSVNNPRYCANISQQDLASQVKKVMPLASDWMRAWRLRHRANAAVASTQQTFG